MEIRLAKTAGFCFGVNRAVELTYNLLDEGHKVATLGPLIHNPLVVDRLAARGDHVALWDGMPRRLGDLADERRQRGDDHRRHARRAQARRRRAHALVEPGRDHRGVVSGKRRRKRGVDPAKRHAGVRCLRLERLPHQTLRVLGAGAVDVHRHRHGRARRLVDVGRLIEDRLDING